MKENKKKKTVFETVISVFAWFVLVLAVFMCVTCVFATFSNEKNGKEIFGSKILIVASDSMSRSEISKANNDEQVYFDSGDLIIINVAKQGDVYKEGDIISFISYSPESYGKTLTHKIRKVHYSDSGKLLGYTTYGINTGKNDSTVVSPEMILGTYSKKISNLGNFFAYLKTPAGYYLSIVTPSALLLIYFSINVGRFFGRKEALKELEEGKGCETPKE